MKKTIIVIIIFLILVGTLSFLYFNSTNITGVAVMNEYSYTKAICNENYCQDYEIVCKDNRIISQNPITGAAVQFPPEWEDPRDQEAINKSC